MTAQATDHTTEPPIIPAVPHAKMVRETFLYVIAASLGDTATQASLLRYRAEINRKLACGEALTAVEMADGVLMTAIDAWETACIATRESAISAATPLDAIQWPAPPAGLTPAWLSDF